MKKLFYAVFTLAILPSVSVAQPFEISGAVRDTSGQPVPYAFVTIEGTYSSIQADEDGSFRMSVTKVPYCVQVSALGYEKTRQCYDSTFVGLVVVMKQTSHLRDEFIVSSTRVDDYSGVAFSNVDRDEIEAQNFGQDLPYVLNTQTSVVTTSDAGNGFGYTGLRIRGSDANRINVTINGIPVNDAESQGTFWVDLPDVVSSTDNIQIQRGVGTSTNGSSAFGGSLNLQTDLNRKSAYSEAILSAGSFESWRTTVKAGTGIINNRWSFDLRFSQLGSNGFIDRGKSKLSSWYFSGGYHGDRLSIKAITFSGRERTYQCWYGVSEDSINAGNFTYNEAGLFYDTAGVQFYENQVDDYGQDYYQLHFVLAANEKLIINWSLFATKGKGFYEEYKQGQYLSEYGINDTSSAVNDVIRRRWLDNWYYGITYAAKYVVSKATYVTLGGSSSFYDGKHYGEVIWATGLPAGATIGNHYYDDAATKMDNTIFLKVNQSVGNKLHIFFDAQVRMINYSFTGLDSTGTSLPQEVALTFLNPKVGIIDQLNGKNRIYVSFGVGNKEPNRDDFTNSSTTSRPKHESLYDLEAGWKFASEKVGLEVNLYYMHYKNQLVLTGKVNDVGAYTRENVDVSFRRGIEFSGGINLTKQLNFAGNLTFSQNEISEFHEYIDDYDTGIQLDSIYANTTIAFSPSVISSAVMTWNNQKGMTTSLIGKYVGKQFLDNTSSEDKKIDPYFTLNLNASWTIIKPGEKVGQKLSEMKIGLQVNNLLNTMYSSNGYTYSYVWGGQLNRFNYYYPQAGINVMAMLTMKFGN